MAMQHFLRHYNDNDDVDEDGPGDGDDDDSGDDGDHLVLVVPTSGFKGMGATDKHSRLLCFRDHSDVVLTLRLKINFMIMAIILMKVYATIFLRDCIVHHSKSTLCILMTLYFNIMNLIIIIIFA